MLHALNLHLKIHKTAFIGLSAVLMMGLSGNAMAFDAQAVHQMHLQIQSIKFELTQIPINDSETAGRIEKIENELLNMRQRLLSFERSIQPQGKAISNQVMQTPLEDPYLDRPPGLDTPRMTMTLEVKSRAINSPDTNSEVATILPNNEDELNTVPEALLQSSLDQDVKAKAFAPTAKRLSETSAVERNAGGILGNLAPEVLAFNQAKGYFDDKNYAHAERKFHQFIQFFGSSSLISNAYFWLGESYYLRGNYVAAARVYYQGYRVNKSGAKAPDNLFKLAGSLLILGNRSDACAAYYEVSKRYASSHPALSELANDAQKEHVCG